MAGWCGDEHETAWSTSLKKNHDDFMQEQTRMKNAIMEQKRQQNEIMRKNQEQIAFLKESVGQLINQADKNKAVMESKRSKMQTLKTDLQDVMSETDELLREKEEAEAQLNMYKEEIVKHKQMLEGQQSLDCDLEKKVSCFKDRLALEVKRIRGGCLQIIFTCIDNKDPVKPYIFSIRLDPDRNYHVSDCTPEIDDLEMLVTKLNESNNLRAFVLAMRRRFKDSVQHV